MHLHCLRDLTDYFGKVFILLKTSRHNRCNVFLHVLNWTGILDKFVKVIHEVDRALWLAQNLGLKPADVHLRNIIMTPSGKTKLIDVARFYQTTDCPQWEDLKAAYYRVYTKPVFPKKIPALFLNLIAIFYKQFFYKADRKHSLSSFNEEDKQLSCTTIDEVYLSKHMIVRNLQKLLIQLKRKVGHRLPMRLKQQGRK